jgi:hypothetical protein
MITFKRGATNFSFRFFYNGQELGEVAKTIIEGKLQWMIDGIAANTREEAVQLYIDFIK